MAQNKILTISMITREALDVLSNMLNITKHSTRKYDGEFGRAGAKIGTVLNIRKPARFEGSEGPVINIEAQNEAYVPLTLDTQYQVSSAFTSSEFSLSMDDFRERFIVPAMNTMANRIEAKGAALMRAAAYNSVGVPGVALTTNDAFQSALTLLQNNLVPDDGTLKMTVQPKTNQLAVKNGLSLFNPAHVISDQYMKGKMGQDAYGFTWYINQLLGSHTVGTYSGSPAVNGGTQTGSTLTVDGFGSGSTLNVGDVFTIAGVNAVNYVTKDDLGYVQQFVVTAAYTGTGGNVSISPAIVTSGALQNVTTSPADNAVITINGASGSIAAQNFAWHPEAIAFATGHLEVPKAGVEFGAYERDDATGLGLRIVRAYDVRTDQFITRLDLLGGWCTLYDQFLVRINN